MVEEKHEEKHEESLAQKKHICSVCAKPSDMVICHACEDMLRAEALDKKRDMEKHSK